MAESEFQSPKKESTGDKLVRQVAQSKVWLDSQPEDIKNEFSFRKVPEALRSKPTKDLGAKILNAIEDRLEGFGRKLGSNDLFDSYKRTPHNPPSMFLKYLIHRHNYLKEYEDPSEGHELDKKFRDLVQSGRASEKNAHVSIEDLHKWTLLHAKTVIPQLKRNQKTLHELIKKGIGINVKEINGEPHIALARGLNDEIMNREHPISSHADTPETGFGTTQHHAWINLKDVWFSYDLGAERCSKKFGPEDEWLVSNKYPRYQAQPEDVKSTKYKKWHSPDLVFDSASDEELAEELSRFPFYRPLDEFIVKHPNAGPRVLQQVLAKQGQIGYKDLLIQHHSLKFVPRDLVLSKLNEETGKEYPDSQLIAHLGKNPNLTSEDLIKFAPKIVDHDILSKTSAATTWSDNPNLTPEVLGQIWDRVPRFSTKEWLLTLHSSTPKMIDDTIEAIKNGGFDDAGIISFRIEDISKTSSHTQKQAEQFYHLRMNLPFLQQEKIDKKIGLLKLPESVISDPNLPPQIRDTFVTKNQNAVLDDDILNRIYNKDRSAILTALDARLDNLGKLEPNLQKSFIERKIKEFGDGEMGSHRLAKLAGSKGLSQESVNELANLSAPMKPNDAKDTLFRNKSVTPEQLKEAYPKGLPFPEPAVPGNWVVKPSGNLVADQIAEAYYQRKLWEERLKNEHIIKPLPPGLIKSKAPLLFPQLGIADDRRETKIVSTPLERKTFFRAAANQAARENILGELKPGNNKANVDKAFKIYTKEPSLGVTIEGVAGVGAPGHGKLRGDRFNIPMAGIKQSALSAAFTPPATSPKIAKEVETTLKHEDLHRIFSRVQHKYGERARKTLSKNLCLALPSELRTPVMDYLAHQRPDLGPGEHEEAITNLLSYLIQPITRAKFHIEKQHNEQQALEYHNKMKRAYRLLEYIAPTVSERWLTRIKPWLKKGEASVSFHTPQGESSLSAQNAYAIFENSLKLQKSYPDITDPNTFAFEFENDLNLYDSLVLRKNELDSRLKKEEGINLFLPTNVFESGEESVAKLLVGHNKEYEAVLSAAQFLTGYKVEIDDEKFREAIRVYDGDSRRAALIAVGLVDSPENLQSLDAVVELGHFPELSKTEPEKPIVESVLPGTTDAIETASEVARAVTAGLIQPLQLRGKHSKGMFAARDPQTGTTWLIKPGSGKPSPAAGVRDDNSTQSAREAAYWHCADKVSLGRYFPRSDLLVINGTEMAAIKLLGAKWKPLDEQNRKVDGYAREILDPYLKRGDVHRLVVLAGILGDVDAHGQNVLVHSGAIACIDHGSAFAGKNFRPGSDPKSFTPYVLRVFAGPGYSKSTPEVRFKSLPVLTPEVDLSLRKWVRNIDASLLVEVMRQYGIGEVAQKAVVARLKQLQTYSGPSLSSFINALWAGVTSFAQESPRL